MTVSLPTIGSYQPELTIGAWQSEGAPVIYTFDLGSGSYTLTGSSITLQGLQLSLESGSYNLTGTNITLAYDRIFDIEGGNYSITGTFIDFSHLKEIATGWISTKGEGPWEFTEQPNKWGYLNNPRWTSQPTRAINYGNGEDEPQIWVNEGEGIFSDGNSKVHHPCGHWHKGPVGGIYTTPPCIEFIDEIYLSESPEASGLYISGDAMYLHTDGKLYLGATSSGTIYRIDPDAMSVDIITTFDSADVSAIWQLLYFDGDLWALISRTGYVGKWIQKLVIPSGTEPFELSGDPMWAGTVVLGTDGNIYGAIYALNINGFWIDPHRPITGASWSGGWELLPSDYSYYVYPDLETVAAQAERTSGAKIINFRGISGTGWVFNSGPESTVLNKTSMISIHTFNGLRIVNYSDNTTIGPNEIVQGPSSTKLALLRCTSAFTNLTMRVIENSGSSTDYLITGLLNSDGDSYDGSIYHARTVWHHANNRVYNAHTTYLEQEGRIIAVNPSNGDLLYQYVLTDPVQTFTILGDYVYVWWKVQGTTSYITKLTLDLEFVCKEDCSGGAYNGLFLELGMHTVSDGVMYIYNYAKPSSQWSGLLTKYQTEFPTY